MTNTANEYRLPAVETIILTVRGQKVILDADLARIYGVPTKALNQAVKRKRRSSLKTLRSAVRRKRLQT